jgi:hypothetical protein
LLVIDAHVHIWTSEIISKSDLEARKIAAEKAGIEPQTDSTVEDLKAAMATAQIEKAMILPIDSGLNQRMPLSLQEKTDWHTNQIRDEDSLSTFLGLDPRRGEEGLAELERAIKEKDCIGWKMYPPNGFYPDNQDFYPYYELCTQLDIPVVIHQGFTSRFKHVKHARPIFVDKMAADFPSLQIVLAHAGIPWVDECLLVASKNPNVFIDLSGLQLYASTVPMKLYKLIAEAKLSGVFPEKVLFGSDFPLFEHRMHIGNWVDFMSGLTIPEELTDQGYPQVTSDEIELVMGKNAARVFFGEN